MRLLSQSHSVPEEVPAPRVEGWRRDLDPAIVRATGTDALIERLHLPDALVVTTGQQPGLFTGPAYTVHKALAAAALATRLSNAWQRTVVPIFWIAGDDHDFTEASEAAWPGADSRVRHWQVPQRPATAPQHPMSREVLPPEIDEGLAALESDLPHAPARDWTMAWLRRHYQPGRTFHAASRDAIAELLAPYGVLCIDPTNAAFKHAQAPLLAEALRQASELDTLLGLLPDASTGIRTGDGASLVFLETDAGRERLVIDGTDFRTRRSGERFTRGALDELLRSSPERFSANVLLRPVVESALLPTVAYVAGPGEYRYLMRQAASLYQPLGVHRQTPVPRWGGTLIEPWADRLLQQLELRVDDLLVKNPDLEREILQRDMPPEVVKALRILREQLAASGDILQHASEQLDPGLVRSVSGRRKRLDELIDDLERRFENHLRRKGDIVWQKYRRLCDSLRPDGEPQERIFTSAAFLGVHGHEWLAAVAAATVQWAQNLPLSDTPRS